MESVLIAVPINEKKEHCWEEVTESLNNISYKNKEILVLDNSKNGIYITTEFNYTNFYLERAFDRITKARNLALKYAIEKNYDYILFIDADVLVPPDIIQKLLVHKKDIVSAIVWVLDSNTDFPIPNAWMEDGKSMPVDKIETGLVKVERVGMGCTLISKKLFNKEFKVIRNEKGRVTLGEDIYFCNQSKEVYCDTDIQCKHRIAGDHWDYDVD